MNRAVLSLLLFMPALASASPRPLPFSYPYETLPEGKLEVEQYTDLVPIRVERENPDGTLDGVFGVRSILQTELEYGLTDHIDGFKARNYNQRSTFGAVMDDVCDR